MADLIRVFTCASVIALGGFSATSGMLACSSDPETTPADDDDGDDKDKTDAGKTSTSSSSSSSSSASSSSSGATGQPCTAEPTGLYALEKAKYEPAGGEVCTRFAKGGNDNAKASEVAFSKNPPGTDGVTGVTYRMTIPTRPDYKVNLLFDEDTCQLSGAEPEDAFSTDDSAGQPMTARTKASHVFEFKGTKITQQTLVELKSDPAGKPGTPCTFTVTAAGAKK